VNFQRLLAWQAVVMQPVQTAATKTPAVTTNSPDIMNLMDILQVFGISSGILSAVCYVPYIRDILRLKTKPERASWFIWFTLGAIAFASQAAQGATHSLWLTVVQTFGVLTIFLLSLKYGVGGFMKHDIISLVVAAISLVLWYFTNNPLSALVLIIIIDIAGAYPTIIKSYYSPESETLSTWILSSIAGICAMIAVGSLNGALLFYPIYICLANAAVATAIVLGRNKSLKRI
jgi:hypothetical protein